MYRSANRLKQTYTGAITHSSRKFIDCVWYPKKAALQVTVSGRQVISAGLWYPGIGVDGR